MEAPLSAAANVGCDELRLVPLPVAGLLEVTLPWVVALGRPSSRGAHYAALAVWLVHALSFISCFASVISSLPKMSGVFYETMIGWTAHICLAALLQRKTWEALYPQEEGEPAFIGELLRSEVLPDTAESLRRLKVATATQAKAQIAFGVVFSIATVGGVMLALHVWFQRLTAAQMLAVGVSLAATPLAAAVHSLPPVLSSALCSAMADRVRRITLSVRATTAATADYQRLIREIQKTDEDIARLEEYLRWVYVQTVVGGACNAGPSFIIGFGPRPPAGHGYTEHKLYLFFVFAGAVQVLVGIWSLAKGAKITSACQDLGEAINKLRASRSQESGEVTVATSDQILQINNLRYFIRDFNRGQGMGFALKRKKITYTLVLDMVGLAASAIVVVSPILLGMVTVEEEQALLGEEAALINSTALAAGG